MALASCRTRTRSTRRRRSRGAASTSARRSPGRWLPARGAWRSWRRRSWSHNFLTSRYSYFHPDVETDKRYFEAMKDGDYRVWRETPLDEVERRATTSC